MQIVPGLYSLGDKSGGYVRAFLIDDGGELTLVDSLLDRGGMLVLAELEALGKNPRDVKRIILTHAHQSHLGGLATLKAATGARVFAHDWEADDDLKDGDHVGPLTVLHAPGHTPGSMAFYWPQKRALITGDIVTTWPEVALGWPQITLDNKQNRESVGKLCDLVHAEVLCVGHGQPVVGGGAQVMRDLVAGKRARPSLLPAAVPVI
jgi:glyoxylase-like metal-dependent hydrolase (beta-lactamase superfamily II)